MAKLQLRTRSGHARQQRNAGGGGAARDTAATRSQRDVRCRAIAAFCGKRPHHLAARERRARSGLGFGGRNRLVAGGSANRDGRIARQRPPQTHRGAASVESSPAQPTLPSAAALAAEGVALPELRLELHVYRRDRPRDRLLIVNGSRYREGETLAEGPRVVAIDPTGAVLSYQGREFLLTPE